MMQIQVECDPLRRAAGRERELCEWGGLQGGQKIVKGRVAGGVSAAQLQGRREQQASTHCGSVGLG